MFILTFWQEILFTSSLLLFIIGVCCELYSFPEVHKVTKEEWIKQRGQRGIY